MSDCQCPDCRAERRCKRDKCNDSHNHYAHPHPTTPVGVYKSVSSLSAELISPFDLSKEPAENTAVAGVVIGSCAPAGNIFPAIRATLAHIACLAELVGASDAPQFNDVYAFRKYEGDAPCVLVLKPTPMVYVRSTVQPAPAENLPTLVRDCTGAAWTAVTSDYGCASAVDNEATGKTKYTFQQFYGDGTAVPDAKPFCFEIPTIVGLPDCPDDGVQRWLTCTGTVNDGTAEWEEIPCATDAVKGLVELATDAEAIAGTDDTRALTPKSGCAMVNDKLADLLPPCPANLTTPMLTCSGSTLSWIEAPTGGGTTDPGGGTDPGNGGGGACAADDDGVVRAVGDPYVQWQGDWVDTVPFASTVHGTPPPGAHPSPGSVYSIPAPTNQAPEDIFGGTWVSGGTVVVQQNSENANLTCTTWTKTAC